MKKISGFWRFVIIFTGIIALLNILARIRPVCDFYVDNIFFIWSNSYGMLMGLFPFSVGAVMLTIGVILILAAVIISFLLIFLRKKTGYKRFVIRYLKTILVIALLTGMIMTLNCSALYRCTRIDGNSNKKYDTEKLKELYGFLVEKCNDLATKVSRNEYNEAVYDGDLFEAVNLAMKKMGETNKRYRGNTPRAKEFLYRYIAYQHDLIGEYYPFSVEANYSPYLNDVNLVSTLCHEYSHLKGYIYEDEANFMSYLICTESDDIFLQYAGYLSVVYYVYFDYISMIEDIDDMPELSSLIWDYDFETYSVEGEEQIEEDKPDIPTQWIADIETAVTDTAMSYYDSTANYSEVTRLLLWKYFGDSEE